MKRYAPLAAPDDPGAWIDISGFWPGSLGTYKNSDGVISVTTTATGETAIRYAYCAKTLTATRSYVVGAVAIWEASAAAPGATTLTDRTGGVTIGSDPHMAQFGNATICAMGAAVGTPTVVSTGGNFAALGGGSPSAEIVLVAKGFVILANYYDGANTYNDGWWCSDRGDYTTWTPAVTNEAANDRLLDTNGPIVAGCVIDDTPFLFKTDSIYRGTYIGFPFVWRWDCVVRGIGAHACKTSICEAGKQIAFASSSGGTSNIRQIMLYDGASDPRPISLEIGGGTGGLLGVSDVFLTYDASGQRLFVLVPAAPSQSRVYSYNLTNGLWGRSESVYGTTVSPVAVMGDVSALTAHHSASAQSPHCWFRSAANTLTLQYPVPADAGTASIAPYVQSHRYGDPAGKTEFNRLIPLLRSRSTHSGFGASDVCSLSMRTFRERHDAAPQNTFSVAESTFRHQFDLKNSGSVENYADFKVTFTDLIVEIDDLILNEPKPAGKK